MHAKARPPSNRSSQRHSDTGAKPRILVVMGSYLPGEKAGGPIQTMANLVELMGDDYDFRIVTSDRDHTESTAYPDVTIQRWTPVGKALVYYLPPRKLHGRELRRVIERVHPDLIYVNSVLARQSVRLLFWKRFRGLRSSMLVAPRGETSSGAMVVRRLRKRLYFSLIRLTGTGKTATWQASTAREVDEIRDQLGPGSDVMIAADPVHPPLPSATEGEKQPGSARFLFLSRVSPKKNLVFFLNLLARSQGNITLSIYGPQESDYIQEVENSITGLPTNVSVRLHPPVPHDAIDELLRDCHFFVLPTFGENFGHAIWEALRVGRPVLISDTTPWRDLPSANAGWDLDLSDDDQWLRTIAACVKADQSTWNRACDGAQRYASDWYDESDFAAAHAAMFQRAMRRSRDEAH